MRAVLRFPGGAARLILVCAALGLSSGAGAVAAPAEPVLQPLNNRRGLAAGVEAAPAPAEAGGGQLSAQRRCEGRQLQAPGFVPAAGAALAPLGQQLPLPQPADTRQLANLPSGPGPASDFAFVPATPAPVLNYVASPVTQYTALQTGRYNIVVMWIACVGGLIALLVVAGALLMANRSVVAPGSAFWRPVRRPGFPPSPTAAAAMGAPPSPKPGPPVFVVTQPGGGLDLAVRVTPDLEPPALGSVAAACAKAQAGAGGAPLRQTGRMLPGGPGVAQARNEPPPLRPLSHEPGAGGTWNPGAAPWLGSLRPQRCSPPHSCLDCICGACEARRRLS